MSEQEWEVVSVATGAVVTTYATRREAQDAVDWHRQAFGGSAKLEIRAAVSVEEPPAAPPEAATPSAGDLKIIREWEPRGDVGPCAFPDCTARAVMIYEFEVRGAAAKTWLCEKHGDVFSPPCDHGYIGEDRELCGCDSCAPWNLPPALLVDARDKDRDE